MSWRRLPAVGLCALALLGWRSETEAATTFVGPVQAYSCTTHQWADALAAATGATTCAQPAIADITGLASIAAGTVVGNATGATGAAAATSTPVLGVTGTAGTLGLYGSTSGLLTLAAGATTTAYTLTFPPAAPTSSGQALTATTAGVGSWAIIATAKFAQVSKSSNYTLASAGADDGTRFDNATASTGITFTLPLQANLSAGDNWCFLASNVTTNPFEILANTGESLTMGNTTGTTAGNLQASATGSTVCVYMQSMTAAYVWAATGGWVLT
jgi:hypothetical protein